MKVNPGNYSPESLLKWISINNKSGILALDAEKSDSLHFFDGRIVTAPPALLGAELLDSLVAVGRIETDQMAELSKKLGSAPMPQAAKQLVSAGIIDNSSLIALLRQRALRQLQKLLQMSSGELEFVEQAISQSELIVAPLPIESLALEAQARIRGL